MSSYAAMQMPHLNRPTRPMAPTWPANLAVTLAPNAASPMHCSTLHARQQHTTCCADGITTNHQTTDAIKHHCTHVPLLPQLFGPAKQSPTKPLIQSIFPPMVIVYIGKAHNIQVIYLQRHKPQVPPAAKCLVNVATKSTADGRWHVLTAKHSHMLTVHHLQTIRLAYVNSKAACDSIPLQGQPISHTRC